MSCDPVDLRNLTPLEILEVVRSLGGTVHQGERMVRAVLRDGAKTLPDIPIARRIRERLPNRYYLSSVTVRNHLHSKDGSEKFLYELPDGEQVEGVLIPDGNRITLCISTQVGCRSGCAFCLSGSQGWQRNLQSSEMLGQVHAARKATGKVADNLVLMGSGEPLDNFENVKRFAETATDRLGLNISPRKITISTSGLIPGIRKMTRELPVSLAVSLNAPDNELRNRLMPINRKYPLKDLLDTLRSWCHGGKRVFIEYILFSTVNDSPEHARQLVDQLAGLRCVVNLLPFNEYPGAPFTRPPEERVRAFQKVLLDSGLISVVRDSRGTDIMAACGQLRAGRAEADFSCTSD